MNDLQWYATNAATLALFIEALKRFGMHYIRDSYPRFEPYYAGTIKALAVALGVGICFVAQADAFVPLQIYGFHPYVGYTVGGVLLAVGNSVIDDVWDNRTLIKAFLEQLQQRPAGQRANIEAVPHA